MQPPKNKSESQNESQPEDAAAPEKTAKEDNVVISSDAIDRALRKAMEEPDEAFTPEAGEEGEATDALAALESLKADYEAAISELKDQLLRAVAETENVRRRASRDIEETGKYAISGFSRDLITVAENLHLALDSVPEEARQEEGLLKTLAEGVEMILREMLAAFERQSIQRIYPLGEKFDHNRHQAVSQVEDPQHEPNTVLHVMQAGYTIGERLLRPAMVVVSKQGKPEQKVDTQV